MSEYKRLKDESSSSGSTSNSGSDNKKSTIKSCCTLQ